jgi:hypothetical protein
VEAARRQASSTDRLPFAEFVLFVVSIDPGPDRGQINRGDVSAMRNVFAWLLITLGLVLAVGGAGMIVVAFMLRQPDVSLAGVGWTVLGAILAFAGFRLRAVASK